MLVLLRECLRGVLDLAAVDGPGVKKQHIPCLALEEVSHADIGIVISKLQPITIRVLRRGIALVQFFLSGKIICVRDHLQPAHSIRSHIHQGNHPLHAMESPLADRILIDMQVLHEG